MEAFCENCQKLEYDGLKKEPAQRAILPELNNCRECL